MRSVVVVLPASMCAMMPMLRSLARAASTAATVIPTSSRRRPLGGLPAVVGEGLVRLRHLVGVFAALDRGAQSVARVEQLVHQPLDHGLLPARLGVRHEPAQPQRDGAGRADLDRYLVGGAADA